MDLSQQKRNICFTLLILQYISQILTDNIVNPKSKRLNIDSLNLKKNRILLCMIPKLFLEGF